jgi:hypothetical protein
VVLEDPEGQVVLENLMLLGSLVLQVDLVGQMAQVDQEDLKDL